MGLGLGLELGYGLGLWLYRVRDMVDWKRSKLTARPAVALVS